MTLKVVKVLKYLGLFSAVFFTIISCEKEIESIGVNLVDNNIFETNQLLSEVITTTENIDRIPTNITTSHLLGVYNDNEFGELKASIISQLSPSSIGEDYNYGTNAAIDSVIVFIPFPILVTDDVNEIDTVSIIGDIDKEFQINVYELKTFLNTLDSEDPSKNAIYYSDKEFQKGETALFSGNFKFNPNDTVSYIKRYKSDGITQYDTDTILRSDLGPSLKIPLNESMIHQLFVENASSAVFATVNDFQHYFRGLYIETEKLTQETSHIVTLDLSKAIMTIYYSNNEDEAEGVDLNGNGTNGEKGVRIRHEYNFTFGSINANVLKRDYTNSKESGDHRIYVQGAQGSLATVELLNEENLENLQNNNWLITDADLIFYVDQTASSNIVPNQLFLFNYNANEQIRDMMTEGPDAVGGKLERDENGNPYRYVFKITDYISEILKAEEPIDLVTLGLKVYNITDIPTNVSDIYVDKYSWDPRGVVLYGHDQSAGDKRIKLDIHYSEINN